MAVLRLPGGQRVSTQSVKRYHLVALANPARGYFKARVVRSSNDPKYVRQGYEKSIADGTLVVIDRDSGSPVR